MTKATPLQLKGGNRTGLLLAALLAVVAGVLVFAAVRSGDDGGAPLSVAPTQVPTGQVVRAAVDIPAGAEITAAMVEVLRVPRDGVLPGALNQSDLVVGKTTRIPIYKGEQFVEAKIIAVPALTANSLSYIIPEGKRAMAVNVSKVIAAGGNIRPGDRVDVLLIIPSTETTPTRAVTVAQNIEVLAIEQALQKRLSTEEEPAEGTPLIQPGSEPGADVITLALSPAEVQEIFLAETTGTLRLALRGAGDSTIVELQPAAPQALLP